ncbi:MAG: RES family NAD+ phosphorylase [Chloroflexi bacterium]|nr:RES family NAD+ phosphorylase [Chloroflexota bacterium]
MGNGRFDDPRRQFRVLYAAAQRRGAFIELLARLRPSLAVLARLQQVGDEEAVPKAALPSSWYQRRAVARLRLSAGQRWLDLRATETRQALRGELATTLLSLGFSDLDVSGVFGPQRTLTQTIARWAYERGYAGLAYASRLDATLTLWALFEGASFEPIGLPEPITPDDPDLVATAQLFGLVL